MADTFINLEEDGGGHPPRPSPLTRGKLPSLTLLSTTYKTRKGLRFMVAVAMDTCRCVAAHRAGWHRRQHKRSIAACALNPGIDFRRTGGS